MASLGSLLGLSYPWIIDMAFNESDGCAYLLAAECRENSEVVETLIYRISGFGE